LSLFPQTHQEHVLTRGSDVEGRAERIVTTLPSATEIVSLLGLEEKLVGVTHECDFPPSVRKKPVVMRSVFEATRMTSREIDDNVIACLTEGRSVYQIDESLLRSLSPDLIITQELCEVCATPLREVAKTISGLYPKPRILSLTPHNLKEVIEDVVRVGRATGTLDRAQKLTSELKRRVDFVREKFLNIGDLEIPTVFCLEWLDPIYCSGHWMPELVEYAGGKETLGRLGEPSTVVDWKQVREIDPEVIFVTVCGYDVHRTLEEISTLTNREGWNELRAVKSGKVFILDSPSYFSRSGPRLVDGLEIMAFLLHPNLFPKYNPPKFSVYSLSVRNFI
ncbi:MAG: cobalamin-binding protein, partial [Thaumarchaeota archaeon]|nr:cobalamin-binding protein [Nitrososphaerota archaeon]